jgi:hypothetical protein
MTQAVAENATPVGQLIDELQEMRLHKADLDRQLKDVEAVISDLKIRIRETMDVLGLEEAAGKTLKVFSKDTNMGQIEDIDSFYDFIRDNDAMYFLERRVSQAAFREYLEMSGGEIPPGLNLFVKHDINVRKR